MAVILTAPADPGIASWQTDTVFLQGITSHDVYPVAIVGNDVVHVLWFAPQAVTVTGIKLFAQTQPVSALGTYLFTVTGAGNNLISTANADLELLVAATLTSMVLTATTADLTLAEGDVVDFAFTSNNADLTGTGLHVQILYTVA